MSAELDPKQERGVTRESVKDWRPDELAPYWLSAIIESADDAIISKTLDGVITSWNQGAERIFGYTAEEVIGKPVTILIPPDHIDEEPDILKRIRSGNRVEHYETVRLAKDGRLIDISLTVSPIRAGDGTIIGASKVARDISDRKRTNEALAEQSLIIETVNSLGQTLAAELDLHKLVQAVTDAATQICEAPLGSFFYNVLNENGEPQLLYAVAGAGWEGLDHLPMLHNTDILAHSFQGHGAILIDDAKSDPRYGRSSPFFGLPELNSPISSYLAAPVISRSGELYGGLFLGHPEAGMFSARAVRIIEGLAGQAAVAIDNARLYESAQRSAKENERLYRQAQMSNQMKEEFLSTVSHELRTPLNAILGWSRMLRGGALSVAQAAKALETIERNARAQAQLIDDLLDVSRIITGKLRLEIRPADPSLCIEAAIDAVRPTAEAKGVRMHKVVDTGVLFVPADPVRLQQIVWNLLSNAIKFTPREGRVQVRLERVNSHIEIIVSDTGQGIEADFLPYVFDRFRQADQRMARLHGGMGIGLAIVKQLVELHGGSVSASSRGKDQGSSFTVKLPIVAVYQVDLEEGRVHPAARDLLPHMECEDRLDGLKILVVDDEADTRDLLKSGLEGCGAEVELAGSMSEALATIEIKTPDLLISDIGMPGEDGYLLIHRVRALPPEKGGNIPAIALTAYARTEDRLHALRSGFDMHVPKPVEFAELVAVADRLLRRTF